MTSNLQFQFLPTFPIAITRLDKDKFEKIYNECLNLKDHNMQRFKTGLSGIGTPIHYRLRECEEMLCQEVLGIADAYQKNHDIRLRNIYCTNNDLAFNGKDMWVNYQKKNEYVPLHHHEGVLSWVLWVKIPYDVNEERKEDLDDKGDAITTCFNFCYFDIAGNQRTLPIPVDKSQEGVLMMFPSKLLHQVNPFYKSDGERISVSGNIRYETVV
jgi:hypothetical protein